MDGIRFNLILLDANQQEDYGRCSRRTLGVQSPSS
jgi:hypothetical protein